MRLIARSASLLAALFLFLVDKPVHAGTCATALVGASTIASQLEGLAAPRAGRGGREEWEARWREVGLSYDLVSHFVNDQACYQSAKKLMMCVQAVNALLTFHPQAPRLVPQSDANLKLLVAKTVATAGPVDIVKLRAAPEELTLAEVVKRERAIKANFRDAWTAHFASQGPRIPFTSLVQYVREKVIADEDHALAAAQAINAYLGVADAHARLMPISELRAAQQSTGESLVGIGVVVTPLDEKVYVQKVVPGGPAQQAGLQSGDILTHVDGLTLRDMSLREIIGRISGKEGTSVTLSITRGGVAMNLSMTRREIEIKNVEAQIYGKVGYLKLASFMSHSAYPEMKQAIAEMTASGVEGFVLDLRGNPGGELQVAVDIASLFLGADQVVVEQKSLNEAKIPSKTYKTRHAAATSLPLIVLIDAKSASASELLSGALQDYGRSIVVGQRSFGKGTVQAPRDVGKENGVFNGYKILFFQTVARFLLPSGRSNQLTGIIPDIDVAHKPDATPEEVFAEREEDRYANALPAVGDPYSPKNAEEIARLKECIARTGIAKQYFVERRAGGIPLDYQLLVAADVLGCLRGR